MDKTRIGTYRECVERYAPQLASRYPSLAEAVSDVPPAHKDIIVDYLRSGHVRMATTAPARDALTGEALPFAGVGRCDDKYSWGEVLAYYVEKYNVALPQDFVDHVLDRTGTGG